MKGEGGREKDKKGMTRNRNYWSVFFTTDTAIEHRSIEYTDHVESNLDICGTSISTTVLGCEKVHRRL